MSLLQVVRSCTNFLTVTTARRVANLSAVGHNYQNNITYTSRRSNSSVPKNPSTSESSVKPSIPPKAAVKAKEKEATVAEKGDTYISGEVYYSFNALSFYDIENQMSSYRQPQPSSGEKMKIFCLDKLNPETKIEIRRLVPEEYGYLVEWPGKVEPKPATINPSHMEMSYGFKDDPTKNKFNNRIPL